jgi:hypothetical protein
MIDRVTAFCLAGSALLGSVLIAELYSGDPGAQPVVIPARAPQQARPVQRLQSPPVEDLISTTLAHPLFSATRRPPEPAVSNRPADTELNVRLTGIVIAQDRRTAIFAMQGAKPLERVLGEMVSNWHVDSIAPHAVKLGGPAGTTTLEPKSDPALVRPAPQAQSAAAPTARSKAPPVQPVTAGGQSLSPASAQPRAPASAQPPSPASTQLPAPASTQSPPQASAQPPSQAIAQPPTQSNAQPPSAVGPQSPSPAGAMPAWLLEKVAKSAWQGGTIAGIPAGIAQNHTPDEAGRVPTPVPAAPSAPPTLPVDVSASKPETTPVVARVEMPKDASPSVSAPPAVPLSATEPSLVTGTGTVPQSEPKASPAIEPATLLSRGDALFSTHDVASARLFYQRAAEAGNGEAALRLAETYDPKFLQWAKIVFVQGDPAAADFWYRRARELGAAVPVLAAEPPIVTRRATMQTEPPAPAIQPATLLSRGDSLFSTHDVASARLLYQRAAEGGNREAALRLAETYDPRFLQWAKLTFAHGNPTTAVLWYRRARELGAAEAETLLKDFQTR